MNQSTLKRLKRLEATQPAPSICFRRIIVEDRNDIKAEIASMIAAGEAEEGDRFLIRVIIDPPQWEFS